GLRRKMPLLFVITLLAAGSMAGLPPLAGFVAKESVYAAFLDIVHGDGDTGLGRTYAIAVVAALAIGSMLTMAYTARFVWGVFADKAGADELRQCDQASPAFWFAPA